MFFGFISFFLIKHFCKSYLCPPVKLLFSFFIFCENATISDHPRPPYWGFHKRYQCLNFKTDSIAKINSPIITMIGAKTENHHQIIGIHTSGENLQKINCWASAERVQPAPIYLRYIRIPFQINCRASAERVQQAPIYLRYISTWKTSKWSSSRFQELSLAPQNFLLSCCPCRDWLWNDNWMLFGGSRWIDVEESESER